MLPIVAGSVNASGHGERRRGVEGLLLPIVAGRVNVAAVPIIDGRLSAAVAGLVPTCRPCCSIVAGLVDRPDLVKSPGCRGPVGAHRRRPGERRRAVEGCWCRSSPAS